MEIDNIRSILVYPGGYFPFVVVVVLTFFLLLLEVNHVRITCVELPFTILKIM